MNLRALTWSIAAISVGVVAAFGIHQRVGHAPANTTNVPTTSATVTGAVPPAMTRAPEASGPSALAGTTAPQLPLDSQGNLRRVSEVRDFFDYFLTARSQLSDTALYAQVTATIHAQLAGKPAESETVQLWEHYRAYLEALDALPANDKTEAPAAATLDFDSIAKSIDQRERLASSKLGEWANVFFADEFSEQRYSLARARIMADTSLSAAQKASQLEALDQTLPPAKREALAREHRADAARHNVQQALQQGSSPETVHAAAEQFGPEAAERAARFAQDERDWRERYTQYATQRAQIDAQNLAPEDRERQVTQLRQQFFSNPAEARRAAAFDGS
jgi:lipase chaperone LimK